MTRTPGAETTVPQVTDSRPLDLAAAARALQAVAIGVPTSSLPAAVAGILQAACGGLRAQCAVFWRLSGDGRDLRLFCAVNQHGLLRASAGSRRLAASSVIQRAIAADAPRLWRRDEDADFAALATTLEFGTQIRAAITCPVHLYETVLGLLCIECNHGLETLPEEVSLFLRLTAGRLETAYLAEPATSRTRPASPTVASYPLQQSHLTLTEESLRDLFYFAPAAMLLTDPATTRPIAASQHALALLGITAQPAADIRTSDFWDDADERARFIEQALSEGAVNNYRCRLRKTDGTRFWARISTTVIDYAGRRALMSSITDISATVATEEVLNRTQQTLMTLLEASPFPLIVTRLDTGVIRFCNRKAADMFETPLSGLLGHTAPEFYADPSDRRHFIKKLRASGRVEGFVAKLKTRSGQPFWAMLSAKTLELNDEPVFMVAFADVTRQKNKEEELENMAFKDSLTNAYNRRYFIEAAQIELSRAARNARTPCLALLDIDHFKRLNDTHGHEAGDEVLKEFAAVVQGMLRKTDILARYGGEEFAILLPETNAAAARGIVERIRATVAAHEFSTGGSPAAVTFSAGLVHGGGDYSALVQRADEALYEAKRTGRNRVCVANG